MVLSFSMHQSMLLSGTDFSGVLVSECFRNAGVGQSAGLAVVIQRVLK